MSAGESKPKPPAATELAAAAEWLVIMQSGQASDSERREFEHWLQSSPSNVAACRSLEQTFLRLPEGLSVGGGAVRDILLRPSGRRAFMRRTFGFAMAAVGSAAFLANGRYPLSQLGADIATATGERRDVALSDGAVLRLCARSAVDQRDDTLWLRLGALAIDGSSRSRRVVEVAGARMIASGPGRAFATRLDSGDTLFGVVDAGALVIGAEGASQMLAPVSDHTVSLVLASREGTLTPQRSHGGEAAWVHGMIEAHEERLDTVVAGLRRFDHGLILLGDAAKGLRVSGRFSLERLNDTFATLADTLPVSVRRIPGVVTMIDKA